MEEDTRKENLKMQHLESMVLRDINDSNLQVGPIYFVLKSILKDVESIYNKQVETEYKEFCDAANAEVTDQTSEESSSEAEESAAANNNEEGAN